MLITWDRAFAPFLPNQANQGAAMPRVLYLQDMFEDQPSVDNVYRYYCDRNADPALESANFIARDMQIQQRTYAIAGLMAKRLDPTVWNKFDNFKTNMRLTAQENMHPMDMDHTIRVMHMLDSRTGAGSYSDYIRAPQSQRSGPARSYMDFLPLYDDTWRQFVEHAINPQYQNQMQLPPLPIT